jgi:hypothetical protein
VCAHIQIEHAEDAQPDDAKSHCPPEGQDENDLRTEHTPPTDLANTLEGPPALSAS